MQPKPIIDSLAVMPFINVGADSNAEYLSDGITESLINSLAQLPKLRVVPRTLVSVYKGKDVEPAKVGRDLHVRSILTGKVVHRGDNLSIQTELVDVGELSQLWGQRYDRKFSEILEVQEDIARRVSEKLRLRTSGAEQKKLTRRYTENTEAYQLYMKGRYYWNRRTAELLRKANDYFRQAIEKDPSYGLAYGGLAQSYALFSFYSVQAPAESCPQAKAAARKTIEIDSNLSEPYAALGWVKMSCDWDWTGSAAELQRALDLNPNDATARGFFGGYLKSVGRLEESVASVRRGLETDPLSLIQGAVLGRDLYFAGHHDQAIEQLKKIIEMDPSFVDAHLHLGWVYEHKGMLPEAIAELRKAYTLSDESRYESALGHVYAISGQKKLAEESLVRLVEQSKHSYVAPYDIAVVYAGFKDMDLTFKYLEKAYEDRSFWMVWLRIDPRFEAIRGDPRYQNLLSRMHLTP
jgi:TolB-like protein/Tfp pilus assembly protein PilF